MHSMKGSLLNLGLTELSAQVLKLKQKCNQYKDALYEEEILGMEKALSALFTESS